MRESESCSVVSDSVWSHRLYSPWNSPGQNTGVGSLSLLQGIFPIQGSNPGHLHYRQILYQLSYKGSPGWRKERGKLSDLRTWWTKMRSTPGHRKELMANGLPFHMSTLIDRWWLSTGELARSVKGRRWGSGGGAPRLPLSCVWLKKNILG